MDHLSLQPLTPAPALETPEAVKNARDLAKAKEAAEEFEAVFIAEMMKPMFEGISTDGMFGGGKGEEVFRGILLQEYGKMIAHTGSVGLSSQIKDAIIQMQKDADGRAEAAALEAEIADTPDLLPLTPNENEEAI